MSVSLRNPTFSTTIIHCDNYGMREGSITIAQHTEKHLNHHTVDLDSKMDSPQILPASRAARVSFTSLDLKEKSNTVFNTAMLAPKHLSMSIKRMALWLNRN